MTDRHAQVMVATTSFLVSLVGTSSPSFAENDLFLNTDADVCVPVGDVLTVILDTANLTEEVNGVQVVLEFDPAQFALMAITPGDGAGSPWDAAMEIVDIVTEGRVVYALVIVATGTTEAATMATMEFIVLAAGSSSIEFAAPDSPIVNLLTGFPRANLIHPVTHGTAVISTSPDADGDGVGDACVPCLGMNDGTPCDDENSCTDDDECSAGICVGAPSSDPCCGSSEPCCGNPDPCCGSSNPCCGNPDPCCGSSNPCCGNPDPCCGSSDPCCGNADLCCGVDCDDNDLCTTDMCNPADGSCNSDAVLCTDGQTCDPDTGTCSSCTADNNCSDDNPCTDDTCDSSGECLFTPDDTNSCEDGDMCNGVESCENGVCASGTPLDCDDGLFCNGAEQCVEGICEAGTPPCSGTDSCDEDHETCALCNEELSGGRVVICHLPPGNPDNPHSLIVPEQALNGHLSHGDCEGACNCPCAATDDCPASQACTTNGICGCDSDGDGVSDDGDECMNSPSGCIPESDGCCTFILILPVAGASPPFTEFAEICLFATGTSDQSPEEGCTIVRPDDGTQDMLFVSWGEFAPESQRNENPLILVMDSDKTVTVNWQEVDGPICTTMCGAGCGCAPGAPAVGLIALGLLGFRCVGLGRSGRGKDGPR